MASIMDDLTGRVVTGVVTFVAAYTLNQLEKKPRVVWWHSHNFLFTLPSQQNAEGVQIPAFQILTNSITIQNMGRKTASFVEIIHKSRPDFFMLQPALNYSESYTPTEGHVIRIESLGPKEFFGLELLSHVRVPELLSIRFDNGHARLINTRNFQEYPPYVIKILLFLVLAGIGACGFGIVWLGQFIQKLVAVAAK